MESATPAVDQTVVEGDGREVGLRGMLLSQSTIITWSTAATLPLLLSKTKQLGFTRKQNKIQ